MDAKLQILRDTFQSRFSIDNYLRFSKEFFGDIKIISPDKENASIPLEYRYMVAAYTHVASYRTGNDTLDIFAVKLNAGRSVERARSMQRSFISKLLTAANHDGAIVAFYTDSEPRWRLSFIRLDYEFAAGRVKMSLTPAKRYSYLVGEKEPCHTAMEQLYPIFRNENYKPTLEKIEEAFSVERVTQEFFDKYKERYFMLKEHLDGDEVFLGEAQKHGFTSEQFAKKLMGQLAFLYFLQKKGWLGVKVLPHTINEKTYKNAYYWSSATKEVIPKIYRHTAADEYSLAFSAVQTLSNAEVDAVAACFKSEGWGSGEKDFIRELFNKIKTKNFYDEFLEPLFYEALNQKRGESSYYKRFNCKIPFLNGGLFEPLEKYDWEHCKFSIPNELFSNVETKGERDADGILDIFDRYNFTMNEDEPLEREVAVDPEMLGKIFENLLDAKDRKSKGAFYTPREIVHYMCAESLINYLVGITGVPYEDMKSFISDGEFMKDEDYNKRQEDRKLPQTVYEKLRDIDKALETIKVADPAVGSGAFPLGMLSEIVKARNNITYYFASEFDKSEDRARLFDQRDPYRLKWDTIQNSIFAVDIEASAVDIAKLRLWLSLVVDESLDPTFDEQRIGNIKEKDPRPLPNLDYNIMCGNSLVDEFEGIKLFDDIVLGTEQTNHPHDGTEIQLSLFMDSMQMYLDDLRKEQGRLFGEQNPDTKQEIKRHIDKIIDNIIRAKLTKDNNGEGLKKYEESLKQKTKPYFLWKLEFAHVFREKGGFDIVIGNPPYIGFHHVPNKEYFNNAYFAANGKYDFYVLFIERGMQLVRQNGFLSYICPSYFYIRNYGKNTRKLLLDATTIRYIADFKDFQIFDSALTYTCIFGAEKAVTEASKLRVLGTDLSSENVHYIEQSELKEPVWSLEKKSTNDIAGKVLGKSALKFADITKSISQGIVTGNNDVYLISEDTIISEQLETTYLKKAYKGRDIKAGKLLDSHQFLFYPYFETESGKTICIDEAELKTKCPNLYNYLSGHKETLLSREYFVNSNKDWFELWNPRKVSHFSNRKFVFAEISLYNDFVLADECFYTDSACGAELKIEYKKYEKYLLLYLNSKLATYVYKKVSVPKANGYSIYKNAFLKELPIILPDADKIDMFSSMNQDEFNRYINDLIGLEISEIETIEESIK
ncbi:hypothetical protein MASR2M70_17020 [Bacillota bacterium]